MRKEDKKKLFKDFLEKNHVLIADKNAASRRRLTKTILDLGGKRNQVHSVHHFTEAVEIIEKLTPKLILSDFSLVGGSGFDLFKEYKLKKPDIKDATCILITSNISQSAVAKAAEEDVDSFIIKPYTVTSLEVSLTKAVINKLYPDKYVQTIALGKEQMDLGNYEGAIELFANAVSLNKKPSLALFYHGQAKYFLQLNEDANFDYKKGLSFNSIHFKCQLGLYNLFINEKKYAEAYDVVRNIAKYFPANPDRLKDVVKLAVVTQNYQDMTDYYDIFKGLEDRTDDVIAYICAGMYVSGKYSLMNKDKETAKNTFEKIGISCAGATRFLRAMVTEFHLYNLHSEAQKLLVRFPTESMEGEDFLVSSYLANSKDSENPLNITNGINLVNKGIKDFNSMMVLIDTLCKEDKWEKAEDYLMDVKKWWPELKGKAKLPNKPESIEKNKTANRNIEGEDASVANSTPKDIPA